jgi:hypothetical protein
MIRKLNPILFLISGFFPGQPKARGLCREAVMPHRGWPLLREPLLQGSLTRLAGEVGLNEKEMEEALRTRKYREAHRRALRHAYEEAGVTGVPMFVIGDQVLTGLQDRETLEAVIEEELKAQGNTLQPA